MRRKPDGGQERAGREKPETLVLEATVKPLIWILWAGTIVLCLGCILAVVRRVVDASPGRTSAR